MMLMDDAPPLGMDEERQPPHSAEAEQSVLGSLWIDNRAAGLVSDLVSSESFWFDAHRLIWDATSAILQAGQPADALTVHDKLVAQGLSERVGGLKYLMQIDNATVSARNVRRYAEIVAERYAERELIAACSEAVKASWQTGAKLDDRLDRINALVARAEGLRRAWASACPSCGWTSCATPLPPCAGRSSMWCLRPAWACCLVDRARSSRSLRWMRACT